MKRTLWPFTTAAAVLLSWALVPAAPVHAQDAAETQNADEVAAYMAWYGASTSGETDKALAAAREYLEKFPEGQNAGYVRKWLSGIQWQPFNEAIKQKDMAEMIRLGRAGLADDASFAYWMAFYLRQNELLGSADAVHMKEAEEFSRQALDFVDKGGVPTGIDAAKFDKDANLAWLHQNLALVAAKSGRPDEALEQYATSSKLGAGDAAITARNQIGCASLHKDLYEQAVEKYKALPEAERDPASPSEAATAAIDTANRHADGAIECWAAFLSGGSGSPELRSRIETAIAALWAYRHPDEPEGWKTLVKP